MNRNMSKNNKAAMFIKNDYTTSKTIFNEVILFELHYTLIDVALLISQIYGLNWEHNIFNILLTIFNFELALVFLYGSHCFSYCVYFLSGTFVIPIVLAQWIAGFSVNTFTFIFNFIIMLIMIKPFVLERKLQFFAGFLVYLLILGNLDQLFTFDIRLIMIVPLLQSLVLFRTFIVQTYQHYRKFDFFTFRRNSFSFISLKIIDLGVFAATSIPLYWSFVSKELFTITTIVLVYHFLALIYYWVYQQRILIHETTKKRILFSRVSQNQFIQRINDLSFQYLQRQQWPDQFCSKCFKRKANILIHNCLHMTMCKKCWLDCKKKKAFACWVCGSKIISASLLKASLGKIIFGFTEQEKSQFWSHYRTTGKSYPTQTEDFSENSSEDQQNDEKTNISSKLEHLR